MAATSAHRVLLSLSDIADLAGVRRPVVTVWRSRSARSDLPFPSPVSSVRGRVRFDAEQVAEWLDRTGHGNNPEVAVDAPVFGVPDGIDEDDAEALGAGMSAVLCLKALTGQALARCDLDQVTALAQSADPRDELLLSEVCALGERVLPLAGWADAASDAAYSVDRAFERLVSRGSGSLAAPLHDLVAGLAKALSVETAADLPVYLDATPGGSEVMLSILRSGRSGDAEVDTGATVLVPAGGDDGRQARRRLVVHGVHPTAVPVDDGGRFAVTGPVVHVLQAPALGTELGSLFTAIDDIQLQMDDDQRAIVIAPAAALCDRLADRELDRQRDHLLRLGRVRAVVRLPEGLVTSSPRRRLGLWVLGPAHAGVRVDRRWTSVADLSDVVLTASVVDDLVNDLVAAMGDEAMVRAHAFRFVRLRPTSALLAGRRALVGPGVGAATVNRTPAADQAVVLEQVRSLLVADGFADPLGPVEISLGDGETSDPVISIGDALEQKILRVVPGSRVEVDDLPDGRVRVLTVADLLGDDRGAGRSVDVLALETAHPAARRTAPGDVVFCTSPRPAAFVDGDGGLVVVSPARVLRVVDPMVSGLVPQVVARDIAAQPASARAWRAWRVRRVPRDQVAHVSSVLVSLKRDEASARARLRQLDRVSDLVVQGVASRALILTHP